MPPPLTALRHPVSLREGSVISQLVSAVRALLLDRAYFAHFAAVLWIGELVLGLLVIRFIPYTKIDWDAYMQHVQCFLKGERDYSRLQGETGPAVYPALYLYIYTALHELLPSDPEKRVRAAQYVFLGIYQITLALVMGIYHSAESRSGGLPKHFPQVLLVPLCLSKRLHSIYMLRLFNDPIAMLLLYAAVFAFMGRSSAGWTLGTVLYSLALGIKMNILLFLPGLLVLLVQFRGLTRTLQAVCTIATIQIALPAPFFLYPSNHTELYFRTAFDFSRQFLYKWTVNLRFVPEDVFLSTSFAKSLLAGQLFFLVVFAAFKWSPIPGGTLRVVKNALAQPGLAAAVPSHSLADSHIPLILFTSNLLGICFARSLHYQFHSWYFHQIPFLLYSGGAWGSLPLGSALWLGIEYAWATYPSTQLSSGILSVCHAVMVLGLLFSSRTAGTLLIPNESGATTQKTALEVDNRKIR